VKDLFISSKEILRSIGREYAATPLNNPEQSSVEMLYGIKGMDYRFGIINAMSDPFCSRCNRLRLMANGVLKACLFGEEGPNLKKMLGERRSYQEIRRAILTLIMKKPERHFLEQGAAKLSMNRIGG
jgi:cyclic pyranopterin phosphate synthase